MDYGLVRGEGELGGHEKEAMGGGGALCRVPSKDVWVFGRKVQLGDGARESGAKSGRVKSAASDFGVPDLQYLLT